MARRRQRLDVLVEDLARDPDDLAELYWDMYTKRDRIEQLHP